MASYNLSTIFQPQYIGNAAAALTLAPVGGVAVPANYAYQISSIRVSNVTGAPVSLTVWRVNSGAANDAQHNVTPVTVIIPVASNTAPQFDLTALWGALLRAGDAIWAQAGAASSLIVYGDGAVISGNSF